MQYRFIPQKPGKENISARAGEPPARVPHAKTVPRTVSSPLLRFCKEKNFAPCAERPKVSPLDSTAFEKAGEILLSGRRFAKTFRFFCPTESFSYPYNRNSAKLLSGQASKEIIARPARICSAAARAAIRCTAARATIFTLEVSFLHNIWYT